MSQTKYTDQFSVVFHIYVYFHTCVQHYRRVHQEPEWHGHIGTMVKRQQAVSYHTVTSQFIENGWNLTFQVVALKCGEVSEQTVKIIYTISKVPDTVQNHWIASKEVVTVKAQVWEAIQQH